LLEDLGGDATESIPIPNVCTHLLRHLPEQSLTGRRSTRLL
jgi:hypothetical protein